MRRRDALKHIGVAIGAVAIGCGHDTPANPEADASLDPPDASPDAPAAVDACTATSSLTPEELLAGIDTFVILCMENRSFDHFLGARRLVEMRPEDGLTGNESNPDPNGTPVPVHALDNYTPADPPHGWDASHAQWNAGANDGFVREHAGDSQSDVMGYYTRDHVPITNALADQAAVCQRWFASVMGPTWPNRFYLHGATSNGQKANVPVLLGFTSIFARLDDAGISNVNYFHDVAWAVGGYAKLAGNQPIEQFFTQAMAGTLPQVSLIDPQFFGSGANDDHPAHDIRMGQALIASVVAALGKSPQWSKSLLVITYDEHGGFFDHVSPPTTVDDNPEFQQLGFRVPTIVVGPTVRRGCAIDAQFEHASVAATLTKRFGLAPLNARASAANDLSPCIDPTATPAAPPVLPPVTMPRKLPHRPPSDAHSELHDALAANPPPRHLDRRSEADAVTARVLGWAERLGAVTFVD
jgi:phospholipase C